MIKVVLKYYITYAVATLPQQRGLRWAEISRNLRFVFEISGN